MKQYKKNKSMNGYQLIARLRYKRQTCYMGTGEQALYHELVAICNEKRWQEKFEVLNQTLCANLHISEKTLIRCRKVLAETGLISFEVTKDKRKGVVYTFIAEEKNGSPDVNCVTESHQSMKVSTCTSTFVSTDPSTGNSPVDTESLPYYINNINNKTNKYIKPEYIYSEIEDRVIAANMLTKELDFPFKSQKFLETWNKLFDNFTWVCKRETELQSTLDKLSGYEEEFATVLVERAAEAEWSEAIFPTTHIFYNQWLHEQNYLGGSSLTEENYEESIF